MSYSVYGLFHPVSQACLYIGRTTSIDSRQRQHTLRRKVRGPFVFRVIRKCKKRLDALHLERQEILSRRPKFNRNIPTDFTIPRKLLALKRGQTFLVLNKADRSFAIQAAMILESAGILRHRITTKRSGSQYKVLAY